MAVPMAYGGSQARVWIRVTTASLATATAIQDPSYVCDLHHSSWQCQILNPLSETRNGTCVLMETSRIRNSIFLNNKGKPLRFLIQSTVSLSPMALTISYGVMTSVNPHVCPDHLSKCQVFIANCNCPPPPQQRGRSMDISASTERNVSVLSPFHLHGWHR